jgi:hypothetical protein
VQKKINYKNEKKNVNGYEEYHYHDGGKYAVEWENGEYHGKEFFLILKEVCIKENGKIHGKAIQGRMLERGFKDNRLNSQGSENQNNGSI